VSLNQDGSNPLPDTDYEFVTTGDYDVLTDFDQAPDVNLLKKTGVSTVKIKWKGIVAKSYYLFLEVDDTNCKNLKGFKIDLQVGDFNAMIADVTGSLNPGTVDPSGPNDIKSLTCLDETDRQPITNLVGNPYSLGTSAITYRVNREFTNTTNGWQVAFEALRVNASIETVIDEAGTTITADGSGYYAVDGAQDYVLVTVTVINELVTPAVDLTLDATNTKDTVTGANDSTTDNVATHTFNAVPTIGTISGS